MHDQLRQARATDHPAIVEAIQHWWSDSRTAQEARELSLMVPRVFLEHFSGTSLVAERDGRMLGFLVGFHSQDHPDEAYIHFVGVDPDFRGQGVARRLYESFFSAARLADRTKIRAVTSPSNINSIAFHRQLGFEVDLNHPDHDGPGQHRARMLRVLE